MGCKGKCAKCQEKCLKELPKYAVTVSQSMPLGDVRKCKGGLGKLRE
jgi:hypothetical protein